MQKMTSTDVIKEKDLWIFFDEMDNLFVELMGRKLILPFAITPTSQEFTLKFNGIVKTGKVDYSQAMELYEVCDRHMSYTYEQRVKILTDFMAQHTERFPFV